MSGGPGVPRTRAPENLEGPRTKAPAGLGPGTLMPRPIPCYSGPMAKNRWYHFSPGGEVADLDGFEKVLELRKAGGFSWCAFVAPGKDDLEPLVEALGLHPLSVEDCFDDDHLPKIDIFPGYTGILFNDFLNGSDDVTVREINFFLGKDFIVSVLRDESADTRLNDEVLAELAFDAVSQASGPARILHAILDRVIDRKFSAVESIGDRIARLEDLILGEKDPVDHAELQGIRQNLLVMRKSLFHEREILARICRHDSVLIQKEDLAYFSNLYDHLAKFVELVEASRETMTNLVQIQLSLSSNAMAESANRTNRSVNRLTLITTIFMPLSLIAGIGGMSEWTMMTGQGNWKTSYPILIGLMALVGVANFILLKWLQRKK